MKLRKKTWAILLFTALAFSSPITSIAQDEPEPCPSGPGGPGDPGGNPDEPCPIDGGLSFLIAAGIGLGAKRAYDAKRKQAI